MDGLEVAELDEERITREARLFGKDLFSRFPDLRLHAAMERRDGQETWTLLVRVPAESGDPRSELVVWVDGGDDPSVGLRWLAHP